ncbi:hypothetical protein Sjap_022962 [Stephania japonica]|uniref:Uncharacterized protein n=1 Tax=Stephania japonica TaxID=461633 RepID=A0AAP0EPU4_9MAGN
MGTSLIFTKMRSHTCSEEHQRAQFSEIMSNPERFVEPDPELPLALLDQKEAFFLTQYH